MTALNYSAGTVSLTNGSAVVTGIDTAWATALLKGGEIFVQAPGNPLPIATIDSDTQITAALSWTGETGVYPYVLRVATVYDQQIAKNAEVFAQLRAEIEAGTIWKFDVSGVLADRDTYDTRPRHFSFLEFDDPDAWLWVKASNAEGDWAGPFAYGVGPTGPAPSLSFSPVTTGTPGTPASVIVTGSGPYNLAFTVPAGLTGVRPRGAYSAGTSYLERDAVRDNGSTWLAKQDTIGNAPPVLPVTSNAFWELLAEKGLDGTGTGTVVGPAGGVIDGRVALFDGTTGNLIKQGVALGDAATKNIGSTSGTVAAGDDPRFSAVTSDVAIASMYSAKGAGFRLYGDAFIADGFGGNDGQGASTNVLWDAVSKRILPGRGAIGSISKALGIAIGNMTANGGLAAAFDNITSQNNAASANSNPSAQAGWVGKNFSSAPQRIYAVNVYGSTDYGYDTSSAATNIVMQLRATNGSPPSSSTDGVLLGTTSTADANGIVKSIFSSDTETKWDYLWVYLTSDTLSYMSVAEVDFLRPGLPQSMTFVTSAVILDAAPAKLAAKLIIRPFEALTLNTDLTIEFSRNGGSTWVMGTLLQALALGADRLLTVAPVTMTGGAGTQMMARISTPTSKDIDLRGLRLEWT